MVQKAGLGTAVGVQEPPATLRQATRPASPAKAWAETAPGEEMWKPATTTWPVMTRSAVTNDVDGVVPEPETGGWKL